MVVYVTMVAFSTEISQCQGQGSVLRLFVIYLFVLVGRMLVAMGKAKGILVLLFRTLSYPDLS